MKGYLWQRHINKMPQEERQKYASSIDTLSNWKLFDKEYGWTGYRTVGSFLKYTKMKKVL